MPSNNSQKTETEMYTETRSIQVMQRVPVIYHYSLSISWPVYTRALRQVTNGGEHGRALNIATPQKKI